MKGLASSSSALGRFSWSMRKVWDRKARASSWPVAVIGFTLLGCGVAVVAPLSFSAAAALAGRDADDEGAQGCEPALGGALAHAALDLDPDDGDRHGQAGHRGHDRGEGDQTGQRQVERHDRGRASIPLTRCTSSRGLKGLTM